MCRVSTDGEEQNQARVTLSRIKAGRFEQSLMVVGLRGVGKTVLLNRIRELADAGGYGVVMVEATESRSLPELILPALRQILFQLDGMEGLSNKVKRGLRVLRSFVGAVTVKLGDAEFGLDIDAEKGTADSGDLEADLAELFVVLGQAAQDRKRAVAIIVDEVQYLSETEMSALIMAVHRVAQRQLPLVLVGAGLPQLVGLAGRSKSYAERLFRYPSVGALSPNDAKAALRDPVLEQGVRFTEDALDELVRVTQGYPYFLQEWGYQAWNLATASPIGIDLVQRTTHVAIQKLDGSFFRVRFDRLTPREKDYMRAMADGRLRTGVASLRIICSCRNVRMSSRSLTAVFPQ